MQATNLHKPNSDLIKRVHEFYMDRFWIYNVVGKTETDKLLEVFMYARQRYNVDVFVIDSLLKLGIAVDDFKGQEDFMNKLCDFKNNWNCQVHLVCHPRKPQDEYSRPGKLDIKGSGGIVDLADNCFTIWRNKQKYIQIEQKKQHNIPVTNDLMNQPDCLLSCDKCRTPGGWEGTLRLIYDQATCQFLRKDEQSRAILNFEDSIN